ncbi:restriction endonuclease subunit S [Gordonia alkanivorans]|uniref:restriction endonuclease subunit S n=1 Tax=Gordonia alkanivorans TaxID=84096 RepID=UPI00244D66C5|nr:restriction endonuclease subunit S [Gordonia alkanivorans]MDH3013931.1 restriction endonuclease subunit S [Gordonia alkanivorans]
MSRIDELIKDLAPGGVQRAALGEVGEFIRGNGLQKADLREGGVPAVHYGQIHTYYGVWTTEAKSFTDGEIAAKLRHARPGDLLIATTSEDDGAVAKATAWLGDTDVVLSGDAYIYRHELDPKYVSYFFQSTSFQDQKRRFISGTKVRRVSGDSLAKIRIPVPPLEVQREIVRILDQFTQLEAELEAELEARRRQYEHYRQRLIDEVKAPRVSIRSLGQWRGGITPSKSNATYWDGGDIPWLASMDVSDESTNEIRGRVTSRALDETSLKVVAAPSVPVVMRSNILRRRLPIGYVDIDTTVNQDIRALVPGDGVSARYIYQVLRADSERIRSTCVRTDGSMAAVDSKLFFEWTVPLPSLEEQASIAARLDHFDSLVNDLSVGLPAELAARRKQYEYYRDKLLTFKGATA